MEFLTHTWHWSISGFLIGMVMLLLIYFGKTFGMSSNLRSLCAMTGAGRFIPFFDWDWKEQRWNLLVVFGAMLGGFLAVHFLNDPTNVFINPKTVEQLKVLGIDEPNGKLIPNALFDSTSPKSIFILIGGGFLLASVVVMPEDVLPAMPYPD